MNLFDLHTFYFYDKQTDYHDERFDDCGQTVLLHQEYHANITSCFYIWKITSHITNTSDDVSEYHSITCTIIGMIQVRSYL